MEQQGIHSVTGENLDRGAGVRRKVVIRNDVFKRAPFAAALEDMAAHLVVVTATDPAIAHAAQREEISVRVAVGIHADRGRVAANVFYAAIIQPATRSLPVN